MRANVNTGKRINATDEGGTRSLSGNDARFIPIRFVLDSLGYRV
jgi:hypothetical protein